MLGSLVTAGCADSADAPPAGDPTASDPQQLPTAPTSGDTVLRVHYPADPGFSTIAVRGSLTPLSWDHGQVMRKLDATTYQATIRGLKSALEWKPLLDDSTWSRGANYHAQPGQTVDIYPHFRTAAGRYERHYPAFASAILGNTRGVWVYFPPSYTENPLARYPVVYMHDGQNLFDPAYAFGGNTWKVKETLDGGIDALDPSWHLPEVLVVGPENTPDRIYEYTPTPDPDYPEGGGGDKYLRFLIEELKPVIDRDLRTVPTAAATTLVGSSLGGLISAYAGTSHADVWSRIGAFSPSTWWDNRYILGAVKASPQRPSLVYVDSGDSGPDMDDLANTRDLAQTYRDLGYRDGSTLLYVVQAGGQHSEIYWAERLPGALRFLLQGL
jgi:predicted alpha/beta superfamily hydrolase